MLLITMLTIKILFTIHSLKKKKLFGQKRYLYFLSLQKYLVLIREYINNNANY